MKKRKNPGAGQVTFRRFEKKGWAVFRSLSLNVRIGVLSVATLASAAPEKAHARFVAMTETHDVDSLQDVRESKDMDELTVAASMAPLTQLQSARIVSVVSRRQIEQSGAQSVNDLLKTVSGVDVRQRGGFGIQTDVSIDGGQFDQVSVFLNGVNISNPHTGHLAMDLPVGVSDIERIEILEGAVSRVYGGFGGAINIVTIRDRQKGAELAAEGGMYGTVQTQARVNLTHRNVGTRLSGGWGRSDGGTDNSDWQKGQFYYQGDCAVRGADINWQVGYSQKSYGANTFYSAAYPNQYERNRRILVSVGAETNGFFHFTPQVYWNRTYDNFELKRDEAFGENFHRVEVYGIKLGGWFSWKAGKTAVGAEMRHEGIYSTSLGKDLDESQWIAVGGEEGVSYTRSDQRTNISFSLEHNVLLNRWTISAGVLAHVNTGVDSRLRFCPGVDVSYRPLPGWKLFASYNMGYRLPTFTELYYKSPTHNGNTGLKPEESHNVQIGSLYRIGAFDFTGRVFYHRGHNMIDWVMYTADDQYHSASFELDNLGVQADVRADFRRTAGEKAWVTDASLSYTYLNQWRHDDVEIFKSNYAMEYLRHKLTASISHRIWSRLSATWSMRMQDRNGSYIRYVDAQSTGELVPYSTYATLDAKIQWTDRRFDVWTSATNLTNTHYHDYGNIPQPGIWVMAGARFRLK